MAELELQLRDTIARLNRVEAKLALIENPPPQRWMSPQEVEVFTSGKYTAASIKRNIDRAVEHPADSPLQVGVHYVVDIVEVRKFYRVDLFEYDLTQIELMRSI
jgi:hypothetical protein